MQPLYVRQCIAESTHKNNSHIYIVHTNITRVNNRMPMTVVGCHLVGICDL